MGGDGLLAVAGALGVFHRLDEPGQTCRTVMA